jgi:hypothetical protein
LVFSKNKFSVYYFCHIKLNLKQNDGWLNQTIDSHELCIEDDYWELKLALEGSKEIAVK